MVIKIIWYVLHSYDQPALDLSSEVDLPPPPCTHWRSHQYHTYYKKDAVAFQDVQDLHVKLSSLYDQIHNDVAGLLNIYLSLSAQKTNDVMKILTVFSVFFMPLTFIVGIYGMNFEFMPELKTKWGYPGVFILMLIISVCIYIWFKKKKWL